MSEEQRTSIRISELELALGGKYKILGRIGAGGFGEVYLGEHTQLKRKVAIKILLQSISSQQELVQRFQREARSAATLTHPNIIDIYDVGEGEGIYYFVMKYIDGETLSHKMQREKRVNPAEAIRIIQQVADALDYAHANDVVHRDIKPANVMLDNYGKPLLMDFGVARVQYEGNLTKTGTLLGTPHYLAPEQPLGKPVDGRADIYSLGIMFYEMLAGRPPFHDENSITLIFKHINEAPAPLNSLLPDLDPELCLIIHKMIEKNAENRQQTSGEVADALQRMASLYPAVTPVTVRRVSSGGHGRNTEKLLLLAKEHIEQEKLDKAIEIYGTISKRDPQNQSAKKHISEIIPKLVEKTRYHIQSGEFKSARDLIVQVSSIAPDNPEIKIVQEELVEQENSQHRQMDTELQQHFHAAQSALQQNNAPEAIEHLTRAATINSDNVEIKELLKETEGRFTKEINLLCENLDFTGAQRMTDLGKQTFPELMAAKAGTIERHRSLYEILSKAREQEKAAKWDEAAKSYEEFLNTKDSYDFNVFHTLRKEAEESLEKLKSKMAPAEVAAVPVDKGAEPRSTVAARKSLFSAKRLAIIVGIGVVLAGIVFGYTTMLNKQHEADVTQPDISVFNKLATKSKTEEAAKPVVGELSITSDPEGATVFLGDQEKGKAPLKLADLQFGKYTVLLKMKGFKDQKQEIELTAENAVLSIPVVMEGLTPVIGTVVIDSDPAGAFIAMNNRILGQTPKILEKVNTGKYTITLRKDGYLDYTEAIRVKENATVNINAKLQEIPKPVAPVAEKPKEEEIKPGTLVPLGPGVDPPKAVKKSAVAYPEAAQKQKLEGTVKLSLLISETGQVSDVKVSESAHPILDEAAMKTVRTWTYEPARKKGVPVKVWMTTSITFVKR